MRCLLRALVPGLLFVLALATPSLAWSLDSTDRAATQAEGVVDDPADSSDDAPIEVANLDDAQELFGKWYSMGETWVREDLPGLAVRVVVFLLILLVFRILSSIAGRITSKVLSTSRLSVPSLLRNFAVNIVTKLVFFLGLLIALEYFGVDMGPVLAGIGVVGFVIGFALQDTMANFAAGIMLLLYRPFDIGDVVTAGGVTGKVEAMTLVSTTLLTPDNQVNVVPNGGIWGGVITNVTAQETRRVDLTIGVGYGDDVEKVEKTLQRLIDEHELILKDPEPVIKLANLGASSVDFVVRVWTKGGDYWTVHFDLLRSIKTTFDAEGISFPFPQQDVHLYRQDT